MCLVSSPFLRVGKCFGNCVVHVPCQEDADPTGMGQELPWLWCLGPWKGCETPGLTWGRNSHESKRIREFLMELLQGYLTPMLLGRGLALSFSFSRFFS